MSTHWNQSLLHCKLFNFLSLSWENFAPSSLSPDWNRARLCSYLKKKKISLMFWRLQIIFKTSVKKIWQMWVFLSNFSFLKSNSGSKLYCLKFISDRLHYAIECNLPPSFDKMHGFTVVSVLPFGAINKWRHHLLRTIFFK